MSNLDLTPIDLGLPSKFTSFRPDQWDAINHAIYSPKRFVVMCAPTGMGKSLIARAIALITRQRTTIVTSTKGLADQYQRDFGPPVIHQRLNKVAQRTTGMGLGMGDYLFDVRGKNNYQCVDRMMVGCDDGPRVGCTQQPGTRCPYHSALHNARQADCNDTNYSFWMHINKQSRKGSGRGLAPITGKAKPTEVLILDEAHTAPDELVRFLAVRVGERECRQLLGMDPPQTEDIKEWVEWARPWAKWVADEVKEQTNKLCKEPWKTAQHKIGDLKKLEGLGKRLEGIAQQVGESGWVCEEKVPYKGRGGRGGGGNRVWEFEPVWPGLYAEKYLFCGVPKVILISATIRRKTMGLLGVKGHEMDYREWPRVFPRSRNQVWQYPCVRLNWRTKDSELRKWVEGIDRILDSRLVLGKRKGLIHTVSYDRQEYLMVHSRHRKLFMGNTSDPNSDTAMEVVRKFKARVDPCVLVSPSFATGWDFPGSECEWIIVGKVPWPVTQSKVMKERIKRDPQYSNAMAMQDLEQMCGRGMRFELDRCEVMIVDDSVGYFMSQAKVHASKSFDIRKLVRVEDGKGSGGGAGFGKLPPLPPKL